MVIKEAKKGEAHRKTKKATPAAGKAQGPRKGRGPKRAKGGPTGPRAQGPAGQARPGRAGQRGKAKGRAGGRPESGGSPQTLLIEHPSHFYSKLPGSTEALVARATVDRELQEVS